MTMSCCVCGPMETAQSLGDDTRAVVTRLNGHQSADFAAVLRGLCCVGVLRAWPIDRCSQK